MSKQMDEFFRVPQPLALSLLDALVLFDGLGGNRLGGLGGVVLRDVGGGGGDGPPCLTTGDAYGNCAKHQQGQQGQ